MESGHRDFSRIVADARSLRQEPFNAGKASSPTLTVTTLLQYLLGGGLMDWAKTRASWTAMEDVSPIITSGDGRTRNKEGVFLTSSDLLRNGLFHAYKGHYCFWRKPASGSSMPSRDDVKQWIKDLNRKVWDWAQAKFVFSMVQATASSYTSRKAQEWARCRHPGAAALATDVALPSKWVSVRMQRVESHLCRQVAFKQQPKFHKERATSKMAAPCPQTPVRQNFGKNCGEFYRMEGDDAVFIEAALWKIMETRPFELLPFPRCHTGVYWKLQQKVAKAEDSASLGTLVCTDTEPSGVHWVVVLWRTVHVSAIARFVIDSCDHDDYLGAIVATCPNIVVRHFSLQDNHWEGGYLILWFCVWLQWQIANHGLLNDFVPDLVAVLAPPPGWNDLWWTLLWVRDAQKASRARDAMALRLKEPFQLAVDAKAGERSTRGARLNSAHWRCQCISVAVSSVFQNA